MGTNNQTPEEEYVQIKKDMSKIIGPDFIYKTDVFPQNLKNDPVDFYIIDYGGIGPGCEDTIISLYHSLLEQIENKPNTLFIIWSSFTQRWYKEAIESSDYNITNFNVVYYGDVSEEAEQRIKNWCEAGAAYVEPPLKANIIKPIRGLTDKNDR
jgi:hypothetical protein